MKKIINPWLGIEGYNCFGCAPENAHGLKMEFYEEGDEIVSIWKPDTCFQGWFNTLHGGIQSTLLDEIAAWAIARKLQTFGVTSKMELRYLKPVCTDGEAVTLRARITETRRNLVLIEATLTDASGEVCTKASFTYFTYSKEKSQKEMCFYGCKIEGE